MRAKISENIPKISEDVPNISRCVLYQWKDLFRYHDVLFIPFRFKIRELRELQVIYM